MNATTAVNHATNKNNSKAAQIEYIKHLIDSGAMVKGGFQAKSAMAAIKSADPIAFFK